MAEVVTIAATDASASEPDDDGRFTVTLSGASATDTIIGYTLGGTATEGSDFTALPGFVTILATDGPFQCRVVQAAGAGDGVFARIDTDEGDETRQKEINDPLDGKPGQRGVELFLRKRRDLHVGPENSHEGQQ